MCIALPSVRIARSVIRVRPPRAAGVLLALALMAATARATAPLAPTLVDPPDGASGVLNTPQLRVLVDDLDGDSLTVTFEGRPAWVPGPDFTVAIIPDTQYYTAEVNGGDLRFFIAQTEWIMAHRAEWNIVFAVHVGDLVENGDAPYAWREWLNADTAMTVLEDSLGGELPEGMPFHVACGNHEQWPRGDPDGTTIQYNYFFGEGRFAGRSYYGGHYGANSDNHWVRFRSGGIDFIIVSLEFDQNQNPTVLAWADSLIAAHPQALAIVSAHYLIHPGNPGRFGPQGQILYDALKHHPSLLLMVCGHVAGEGRRTDAHEGRLIHTVLANYQNRENGGNGWMRLMRFQPALERVQVLTYSPVLDEWEADADSCSSFTLPLPALRREAAWETIAVVRVADGEVAGCSWPGRLPLTLYEWRASVSDADQTTVGDSWRFTTGPRHPLTVTIVGEGEVLREPDEPGYDPGAEVTLTAIPGEGWAFHEWQGDAGGSANPIQISIDGPTEVGAVFLDDAAPTVTVVWPDGGDTLVVGRLVAVRWNAAVNDTVSSVVVLLSRAGPDGPFERLAGWIENAGSWSWKVTGPPSGKAHLRVVARDVAGHAAVGTGADPSFILILPSDAGPFASGEGPSLVVPNPARAGDRITLTIPVAGRARLRLFDVSGREVGSMEAGSLSPGLYRVAWDDLAPSRQAAGLYYLTLETPAGRSTRSVVVLP